MCLLRPDSRRHGRWGLPAESCTGKESAGFENDPKGPVGVSLRAVKTLGPDFSRRNPRQSFLPVRLLLQGSVTTGNQSSGSAAVSLTGYAMRTSIVKPVILSRLAGVNQRPWLALFPRLHPRAGGVGARNGMGHSFTLPQNTRPGWLN